MLVRSCRKASAMASRVVRDQGLLDDVGGFSDGAEDGRVAISSAGRCPPTVRFMLSRATATQHPSTSPANNPSARLRFFRGVAGVSGVVAHRVTDT